MAANREILFLRFDRDISPSLMHHNRFIRFGHFYLVDKVSQVRPGIGKGLQAALEITGKVFPHELHPIGAIFEYKNPFATSDFFLTSRSLNWKIFKAEAK